MDNSELYNSVVAETKTVMKVYESFERARNKASEAMQGVVLYDAGRVEACAKELRQNVDDVIAEMRGRIRECPRNR